MPVGTGIKREKVPLQQVLLQLSPFYWQGDASWAWNLKVPFWTGESEFAILPFRTRKFMTFHGARRRAAARPPIPPSRVSIQI